MFLFVAECFFFLTVSFYYLYDIQVKGVVRGEMNVSQTVFESINNGTETEIQTILHMDPRM